MKILTSASKIVFILMAVASVAALFTSKITADNFMFLAGMAFSFYFATKPTDSNGEIIK